MSHRNHCSSSSSDSDWDEECKPHSKFNQVGNVLISDQFNNRVIETTPNGEIVWSFGLGPNDFSAQSIIGVNNAERVGELTLMAGTGTPAAAVPQICAGAADNRVMFVDKHGKIVWQYGIFGQSGTGPDLLNAPVFAVFVPRKRDRCDRRKDKCDRDRRPFNGTVLITDQGNNRIIQVDHNKNIVWQYPPIPNPNCNTQLCFPNSAEVIDHRHGIVLIADQGNNRAIEVDRDGNILRVFTAGGTVNTCAYASRLPNGNTLLTDAGNSRIVEVDKNDIIVWQYITNAEFNSIAAPTPTRGIRLRNGHTLISDQYNNRVIEINRSNVIVAYYGLPLAGGPVVSTCVIGTDFLFGNNVGYDLNTTQLGLYSPYDAKKIGDYNGQTKP